MYDGWTTLRCARLPGREIGGLVAPPEYVAFPGKAAYSAITDRRDIAWGLQASRFAGSVAWVLPNPSGLNRAFSLDGLVRAYREFRAAAL